MSHNQASPTTLYGGTSTRRITVKDLIDAKVRDERWPMITAYDAMCARIFDEAGIPALLVGDSAAMVVYGYDSTVPVTVDELIPLVRAVVRGSSRAIVVADLPFGSYQASPTQALETASAFMKDGGAHAVKLEGGSQLVPHIELLVSSGIPVIGHLGLMPQSVNVYGGYRVQGRGESGDVLLQDAKTLAAAGVSGIVLEAIPADLAARATDLLQIPTIGIGAGPGTDAQVIVWQDMVGLSPSPLPRFVRQYANMREELHDAVSRWARDVVDGSFPSDAESYR